MTSIRTISSPTSTTSRSTAWRATTGWRRLLTRLPGRKFIFTNGDAIMRWKVLDATRRRANISTHLHDIHASRSTGPSPTSTAIASCCDQFGIDPAQALLVDDMVQNLAPAKALGMTTVWVDNGSERGNHGYDDGDRRLSSDRCRRLAGAILGDEQ